MHGVGEALHFRTELPQGLSRLVERGVASRLLLLALTALGIRTQE